MLIRNYHSPHSDELQKFDTAEGLACLEAHFLFDPTLPVALMVFMVIDEQTISALC